MSGHTPGPWTWRNAWESTDGKMNPRRLAGAGEATVAIPNADPETDIRVSRADGALIAAAPDLLAACNESLAFVIAWSATYQFQHELHDAHPQHVKSLNLLQAAISKAEGK